MTNGNNTILIVLLCVLALLILISILIIVRSVYHYRYYNDDIKTKPKIAIVTLENRNTGYIEFHNKSIYKYCQKHGYDYIFLDNYESDLSAYWKKILVVIQYLKEYDYVMWLDSDSIVCNYDIKLESILNDEYHIYIGRDYPSFVSNVYCAGIFMVRNSEIGKAFMDECIGIYLNDDYCKEENKPALKGKYAGRCYEQGVMNYLLKTKYKTSVISMPDRIFNNTLFEDDNCFILHFYNQNRDKTTRYFNYLSTKHDL